MMNRPIVLARKPITEKTITDNVLKYGTGGLNIDACRIDLNGDNTSRKQTDTNVEIYGWSNHKGKIGSMDNKWMGGRFPANFIIECTCDEVIPGDKGEVKKSGGSIDNCEYTHEWGYNKIVRTNFTDKGDIHLNPQCPCRILDEQSGESKSVKRKKVSNTISKPNIDFGGGIKNIDNEYNDNGGASRFFKNIK